MANSWVRLHLPGWQHIGRYILWGSGRVTFSLWLFGIHGLKTALKTGTAVLEMTERSTHHLLNVYSQLPHMGTPSQNIIDVSAVPLLLEPSEIITDLVRSLEGKHCLIIGDTGTGKSTIAQWLAHKVGGEVVVYDPDAAPDEWMGLNVVGRRGDFKAIGEAMTLDLEELQRRIEVRGDLGDRALAGLDSVLIAEEFPLLKDEIPVAVDWLIKHARRGRKPKRFLIALAQDDQVKTLGIDGEGGVRKNFRMLRLGKFAVIHAKSLKDNALVEWLKAGKFRCLVDDLPCQLPDLSSYQVVMQPPQPTFHIKEKKHILVPPESEFEADVTVLTTENSVILRAVKTCLKAGLSESRIIKEVLGYEGGKYQDGKALLAAMRQEHGF
ncbi:ATP-binding protein [Patescibacteria group bacterium]|nr:ATP-binding protein [Patescibacteria group bacterium]